MGRLRGCCVSLAVGVTLVVIAGARARQDDLRVHLRNIADAAGMHFVHHDAPTPGKYFVQSAPGGVAVFDYNGDGRPDIFFTNGAPAPSLQKTSAVYSNRLYRNDGNMRFTDVTDIAGVRGVGYAMGAAAADYDNDGHVDLFVAGVRQNQLLHNRGDGRFEDVTKRAGIASGEWAVAAGWFDYDNDGRLDLLVVNYVQWSPETDRSCGDQARGIRIYCHPRFFQGLPNRLYRNRGDGTFEDVSARAGLLAHAGKGMSVAFADFDHDGRLDAFVTNDTVPNFLFRNKGDGTFEETALLAGVSVPDSGRPTSSMGTDVQDYDNDGWEDILVTALAGETFPLFRNDGRGAFVETTQASGLARLTVKASGWCAIVADLDNDGWKDIFTANSHVNARIGDYEAVDWQQANSLFINDGHGRFRDATAAAGLANAVAAHRGCSVADFDGDGRLDVVVLALGAPAELWKNESAPDNRWLIVRLVGTKSNRDGIGARVVVGNQVRTMTTAVGYASSSYAGLHFGLGTATEIDRVEVQWPSGTRQTVEHVKTNQVLEIKEERRN
ncbi:MAG: CRTAC1 family protein [Acidobacteria bacterium]|nr:MAG: CRTAC1 family protein [Acidobacteriota bacterium]